MTFTERFDQLKKKYAKKADITKLKDSFIAAQITMSDEDCGGTFYVAFIDGVLSFEPYDYHDNTVAMIIDSALLEDCIKGKADPVKAYLDGKLQAWGNLDHALNLIDCLKGTKKTAAKKEKATEADAPAAPKKRTCKKKTEKDEPVSAEELTPPGEKAATKKTASKKKTVKE